MDSQISFSEADILGGENVVVHALNMEISKGDVVFIVGKVGSGKTSIIRTMTAENPLASGHAQVCGVTIEGIRPRAVPALRRKIGVVFQDFQLLMDRSVHDNLAFVLRATGWKDRTQIEKRIDETLDAVGMSTKAHKLPHQLSGGEQQRAAIARAILNDPELILADEPTGNLDEETAAGIMDLLTGINKEKGTTLVVVTHNRSFVEHYPGRVFVCREEKCEETSRDKAIELTLTI